MCGRFMIKADPEEIKATLDVANIISEVHKSYNVAPTDDILAVVTDEPGRSLVSQQWGLIPLWMKSDDVKQNKHGRWVGKRRPWINSMAESFVNKPSFKQFLKRRCVIPASAWYEFPEIAGKKVPFLFENESKELLAFAGHWETWVTPTTEKVVTCSIITTTANELIGKWHDRMPVVLGKQAQDAWLDPSLQDIERLISLLKPYPANELTAYQVSSEVNKVANNYPELINPVVG